MKRDQGPLESELESLIARGRVIRRVPSVIRTRALARARATLAAPTASGGAAAIPARGRNRRIAIAAALAIFIGTAGTAVALRGRIPLGVEAAAPPSPPSTILPVAAPRSHPASPRATEPQPPTVATPQPLTRVFTAQESYTAEIQLLQRAQKAYTRRDFLDALVLVAEHGRRFPEGRLAEQREALRVRSLAGTGRMDEARRAVTAFAHRFPRSVLLRSLQETARAAE